MDLNSDSKKKEGYRNAGLLGIPKDVVAVLLGLFLFFTEPRIPGICLIALGAFGLFVDIYFLKKGKEKSAGYNKNN